MSDILIGYTKKLSDIDNVLRYLTHKKLLILDKDVYLGWNNLRLTYKSLCLLVVNNVVK